LDTGFRDDGVRTDDAARLAPDQRIIKGRPFEVGFDCSYQRLRKEHPHE
jgi:hypothetical protein